MLSQHEMMNHAFKDLLFHEEFLAKKYAALQKEITDPQMQKNDSRLRNGCQNAF